MSEQQSLGAMVKGVTEDISTLVRGEIELAKTELRDTAKTAANGGGLLAAAGVFAFLGLTFLLLTLAWVLVQLGLPIWAGFGIVTLLVIIIAAILGYFGKKRLDTMTGPERSQASIEKTKAVLSRKPAVAPAGPAAAITSTPGAAAASPATAGTAAPKSAAPATSGPVVPSPTASSATPTSPGTATPSPAAPKAPAPNATDPKGTAPGPDQLG